MCCSVLQVGSLFFSPLFRSGEISLSVLSVTALAVGARWFFWSEDVGPEVVDLPFLSDFVDGRR